VSQLTIAIPGANSVQQAVQQARAYALRNPVAWGEALKNLSPQAENDIIFAAMDGDEAQTGRRLIHWLRERILADATDKAKDAIDAQLDAEERVRS
jgi:hypothetical protein